MLCSSDSQRAITRYRFFKYLLNEFRYILINLILDVFSLQNSNFGTGDFLIDSKHEQNGTKALSVNVTNLSKDYIKDLRKLSLMFFLASYAAWVETEIMIEQWSGKKPFLDIKFS